MPDPSYDLGFALVRELIDLTALMATDEADDGHGDRFVDITANMHAENIGQLIGINPVRLQFLIAAAQVVIDELIDRLVEGGPDSREQVLHWLRAKFSNGLEQ